MTITHRIVKEPSVLNRAPIDLKVVPKYPNLRNYDDRVLDGPNRRIYDDLIYKSENDIPVSIYSSSLLPKEVGYIIRVDDMSVGVPVQRVKECMEKYNATITTPSKDYIWVELCNGRLVWHNNGPVVESSRVLFIYNVDTSVKEVVRLPIMETFKVFSDRGVKTVRPKGNAEISGLMLSTKELLPILDGEIVYASWM